MALAGLSVGMSLSARADMMGPARTLRKLSQKIRAVDPSEAEYAELKSSSDADAFLSKKASEYLNSPEAAELMAYRLEELLKFEAFFYPEGIKKDYPDFESTYSPKTDNSTVRILRGLIAENRPWNDLLLAKEYRLSPKTYSGLISDGAFFQNVRKEAEQGEDSNHLIFKSGDTRIAGVLTSSLFRARYLATQTNMNRRFAQAVFRIFLCEDLNPAVPTDPNPDETYRMRLLNVIKSLNNKKTDPDPKTYSHDPKTLSSFAEDDHDNLPSCKACHERLDPMAKTFGVPGAAPLAAQVFDGAFVKRVDGQKVETPVHGIGELAGVIIEQDEYASCQVRHFWNWFVGPEVPRDADTTQKWVKSFKERNKVREFVSWIVAQPEFKTDRAKLMNEAPAPIPTWQEVQPIIQKCNQCHTIHGVDFSTRPWGGTDEEDAIWREKIRSRVLLPEGTPLAMPPNPAKWDPAGLKLLRSWVGSLP